MQQEAYLVWMNLIGTIWEDKLKNSTWDHASSPSSARKIRNGADASKSTPGDFEMENSLIASIHKYKTKKWCKGSSEQWLPPSPAPAP